MDLDHLRSIFAPEGSPELERLDDTAQREAFWQSVFTSANQQQFAEEVAETMAGDFKRRMDDEWSVYSLRGPKLAWMVWRACEIVLDDEIIDWKDRMLRIYTNGRRVAIAIVRRGVVYEVPPSYVGKSTWKLRRARL